MPKTLRDLFVDTLRDAYSTEQLLLAALPQFVKTSKARDLRTHFRAQLATTRSQFACLAKIFEAFGEPPEGKVSLPIEGLIAEGQALAQEGMHPALLDAALITAARKVTHYEIAAYSSLCGHAEALGEKGVARSLRAALREERVLDAQLAKIAAATVNPRATRIKP